MNELQSIDLVDFTPDGKVEISGRQLHMKLNVKTRYNDWFSRMVEYGFVEGTDFYSNLSKTSSDGGRPSTDHILTLNMAKEIAMLQRTPEGQEIRRYLLKVEEDWNSPEKVMARAIVMANNKLKELTTKNYKLENEIVHLNETINEMKPKADYVDRILSCKKLMPVTLIAKDYGYSGKRFNKILHDNGVQYKVGKQWVLYSKYQGCGYTHSKQYPEITDSKGEVVSNMEWTQKGRLFLYDFLKKRNILPMIEQA